MTNNFPLFNSINNIISSEKELNDQEKITLSLKIKTYDKHTQELVYALIKCYQINNSDNENYLLPYNGKKLKSGLKFNMSNFPNRLQNILWKFSEMHENKDK